MIRNVVAVERDGFNVRTLTVSFEVPDENFNLIRAIKNACNEYIRTEDGRKTYIGNCDAFNMGDMVSYVPNSICEKYGFKMSDSVLSDIEIDWDEQLADLDDEEDE